MLLINEISEALAHHCTELLTLQALATSSCADCYDFFSSIDATASTTARQFALISLNFPKSDLILVLDLCIKLLSTKVVRPEKSPDMRYIVKLSIFPSFRIL